MKHRLHRLKTQITQIIILSSVFCLLSSVCFAQPISSTELIERAKEYNDKVVEYQGEVVGDVMVRGDFVWVNLNDGKAAIGVFGKKDLIVNLVNCKGGYKYKGDSLKVKGVFHRACPQHGGDLDIHIDEAVKTKEGFLVLHPISVKKMVNVFWLSIVALGLSILCWFRARRK